jgi:hypothetical protein
MTNKPLNYQELSRFEQCIVDNFVTADANRQARNGLVHDKQSYDQYRLNLRDLSLALGGIERIVATVTAPSSPDSQIPGWCRQQLQSNPAHFVRPSAQR